MIKRDSKGRFIKGSQLGDHFSEERNKKISEALKGRNFGYKFQKGHKNYYKKRGYFQKCLFCNKEIYVTSSIIKFGRGKYCSVKCKNKSLIGHKVSQKTREKISKAQLAEKSSNWKGIRIKEGYIYIYNPTHPRAIKKAVKRAILVAEKCLGRSLNKGEIIHHINRIRNDDRPENLYLFPSNSKHMSYENLKDKPKLKSNII